MKKPIVIIGMGEIGGVVSRAFLKAGYPVFPITRGMDISIAVKDIHEPEAVIVAVGEKDFHSVVEQMPSSWFQQPHHGA
jgi:prephenate dehydrogenase